MSDLIRIGILGDLSVELDGSPLLLTSARQRAILAVLAIHLHQSLQPERLLELVWGDDQPANGLSALRFHINKLRNLLDPDRPRGSGGSVLETTGAGYCLNATSIALDSEEFEVLLEGAKSMLPDDPLRAAADVERALELWRGDDALPEFRYEEFAREEIGRLAELKLQATEVRSASTLAAGNARAVIPELQALVETYPYRERLVAMLMEALYADGRQVDALRVVEATRKRYVEELGIDLTPALRTTEMRILEQDPGLVALRTGRSAGNVPSPVSPIVDRESERAELVGLLRDRRLVTLVGLGGVGKTRLAVEIGHAMEDLLVGGSWFIDLSAVHDDSRVLPAIEAGLSDLRGTADANTTDIAALTRSLRSTAALLILDNCEQVRSAVGGISAQILAGCPSIRILATSRIPLGTSGETVRRVMPFDVPEARAAASVIKSNPAFELLRARMGDQDVALPDDVSNLRDAVELCRVLDGLPLAIELAARYLRSSSLGELTTQLDGGLAMEAATAEPDRHRSLEVVLDWSYRLLPEPARELLVGLSIFRGPFDLEAASSVSGWAQEDTLASVAHLVDASLLLVEDGLRTTYRMLETVREFAFEHLDVDRMRELTARHARHYTDVAVLAGQAWSTIDQDAFMEAIRKQTPNLQAAADFLIAENEIADAGRLVSGASRYWFYSGLHTDAIRTMKRVVDTAGERPLEPVRSVIEQLVPLLAWSGRIDQAKALAAQHSRIVSHMGGPPPGDPEQGLLGTIAWCEGDLPTLHGALIRRVEALDGAGDPLAATISVSVAYCLTWMGRIEQARGARATAAEVTARYGVVDRSPMLHDVDGWIAFQSGDLDAASHHWETALDGYERLQMLNSVEMIQLLGWTDLMRRDIEKASSRLERAQQGIEPLAMVPFLLRGQALLSLAATERGDLDRARALARAGMARALATGNRLAQLLLAYAAATVTFRSGDWSTTGRLFGAVRWLCKSSSAALPKPLEDAMAVRLADLRSRGVEIRANQSVAHEALRSAAQ